MEAVDYGREISESDLDTMFYYWKGDRNYGRKNVHPVWG